MGKKQRMRMAMIWMIGMGEDRDNIIVGVIMTLIIMINMRKNGKKTDKIMMIKRMYHRKAIVETEEEAVGEADVDRIDMFEKMQNIKMRMKKKHKQRMKKQMSHKINHQNIKRNEKRIDAEENEIKKRKKKKQQQRRNKNKNKMIIFN